MKNRLADRRQSSRIELNRLVIVKENSGEIQKLVGLNYSTGGIALNSAQPMPAGDVVDVLFWLTEPENLEINIHARVLNCRKQNSSYVNTLQFMDELSIN